MKYFLFFLIFLLVGSCVEFVGEVDVQLLELVFDFDSFIEVVVWQYIKMLEILLDINCIFCNVYLDGIWNFVKKGNWVSGFYFGVLWYFYVFIGDEKWKEVGEAELLKLDFVQFFDYDYDIGFWIFNLFGSVLCFIKDLSYVLVIVDVVKILKICYWLVIGVICFWDWYD